MSLQGDMGGFGQAASAAVPGINPKVAAMQKEMWSHCLSDGEFGIL